MSSLEYFEGIGLTSRERWQALDNTTRSRLARLPSIGLTVPAALFAAQRMRCFHCNGFMPLFCGASAAFSQASREHALPKARRLRGEHHAILLAHALCNSARSDRPLSRVEWQRAAEVWAIADRHWLEAGGTCSPFPAWVSQANRMQQQEAT